jgi:hypothetical protein
MPTRLAGQRGATRNMIVIWAHTSITPVLDVIGDKTHRAPEPVLTISRALTYALNE